MLTPKGFLMFTEIFPLLQQLLINGLIITRSLLLHKCLLCAVEVGCGFWCPCKSVWEIMRPIIDYSFQIWQPNCFAQSTMRFTWLFWCQNWTLGRDNWLYVHLILFMYILFVYSCLSSPWSLFHILKENQQLQKKPKTTQLQSVAVNPVFKRF